VFVVSFVVKKTPPVTLDQLFRKTAFSPKLYWLPVSEEKAKEAKEREAAHHQVEPAHHQAEVAHHQVE
jgi:hypothetical protein